MHGTGVQPQLRTGSERSFEKPESEHTGGDGGAGGDAREGQGASSSVPKKSPTSSKIVIMRQGGNF